ncbi:hypothetical protein [Pseudomonas citronellolis]|uniref:hypothetical protein n=1 Tax=Pseudomonas citronellolis TaxID=53408 RepID=UPI003B982418
MTIDAIDAPAHRLGGIAQALGGRRLQVLPVARVEDDGAAPHDVLDPGAVEVRLHQAPAVDEDHQRDQRRHWRGGGEQPVFAALFAAVPLAQVGVGQVRAAGAVQRLLRRGCGAGLGAAGLQAAEQQGGEPPWAFGHGSASCQGVFLSLAGVAQRG